MVFLPVVNLYHKKQLIWHLSLLNLKTRYEGTHLGFLWTILEPLFTFILLYTVFTSIRITTHDNFPIYLLIGLVFFHMFVRGTQTGLMSLRKNSSIIKSLSIEKEMFPVVSTGTIAIAIMIELAIFFALMPVFNYVPPWTVVFLAPAAVLLLLLILGASYLLSTVAVYFKDIQTMWGIFSYALFFISPIFWYVDEAKGILLEFQKINPIGQLIEIAHKVTFNEIPTLFEWSYITAYVLIVLFVGFAIFKKFENRVAEEI